MRSLTKTGIRILSAKYRSILIKCAIINASMFIGAFGSIQNAMADSWYVGDWTNYKNAINNQVSGHSNIDKIGIQGSGITYEGTLNNINRELTITRYSNNILNGANTFQGFFVDANGILTLENITMKNFYSNNGAAIFNQPESTDGISVIDKITGNFIDNIAVYDGGVIYNNGYNTTAKIGDITADFKNNTAGEWGGAIYNYGSEAETITTINTIKGDFNSNLAKKGGAIYNYGNENTETKIGHITGNFINNYASSYDADTNGGAIYNSGNAIIENITGDFINNSALATDLITLAMGGAVYNSENGIIKNITGDFKYNFAKTCGGAIYNTNNGAITISTSTDKKNIIFDGNYVITDMGGAIYNNGTISLYADAGQSITFVGGEDVIDTEQPENSKYDIDGIFNAGSLNINGNETKTYNGTVNLYTVSDYSTPRGTTNIYGGIVNANGDFTQSLLNNQAEFNFDAAGKTGTVTTLSDAETAKGTTNIKAGSFTVNGVNGATTQKAITVTSGAELTTKNNVTTTNGIANAGTLNLLGGMPPIKGPSPIRAEINSTVSGDGTTNFGNGTDNAYIKLNGAINQAMNIKEKADVETNANNIGAAVTNAGALTLTGGQLEQSVTGGNVTIAGDVTSDASIASTIGIDEGKSLTIDADNIDGAVANAGILTLDDGTLEQAITGSGTTNINDGIVIANGNFVQNELNIDNAEMKVNGVLDVSLIYLNNSAILGFGEKGGEQKINSFSELGLGNSTVNLQNNSIETLEVYRIELYGENQLLIDADLAKSEMDQLKVTSASDGGNIVISDIRLLSDANDNYTELSLFADGTTQDLFGKVSAGNLNGLKYSPIYKYDALYDQTTGKIGFTRYNSGTSDDFNPYIYAPSGVANTTAAMTTQIATLAMDKMDDVVHAQGRSGGDTPSSSNVWVRVMGLNDNVEFNNFENIDSKALTVAAGVNTDKITCGDCGIVFGAYAGYIGGKQQYTENDIDQDGGYVGLSSALTLGDAFLTATVNGGLLKNKATNMYGTDEFRTLWLGTGLKAGYNYAITDSVVLQPNVYGGYTLVNTEDYTSVSGVKIATNNLNFFEVDPGLKLSAVIADGWTGSVQGKYAIVMDNGADITANDFALQNISTKNYIEYGIGIDKSVTDAFYLGAKVNRHDGGRTGWNGSIEFRYKF